ncbi:MAG: slipin family protein [Gammaproteobacteria bacterium]|nr:slipin family protein [Gammaproteobacteria bacterium]
MGLKRLAEVEAAIAQRRAGSGTPITVFTTGSSGRQAAASQKTVLFRVFIVRKNERGLLFENGDFSAFLEPGKYRFLDPLRKVSLQLFDLSVPEFEHPLTDFLLKHHAETMARYFDTVELAVQQVALVYKNGRLADILPPSSRTLFWRGVVEVRTDCIDMAENPVIAPEQAAWLVHATEPTLRAAVERSVYSREVPEHHLGLLYVDGRCQKTLEPGLHAYWRHNRSIAIDLVDTRLQDLEVSGQEILTKDKVNLRINLAASYRLMDVLRTLSVLPKPAEFLYRELQFGLRAVVGTRTLDELLENKNLIDEGVLAHIQTKTAELGIEIASVGVKDIILPGDMKTLLGKVVEAEKAAQANIIRRREETAATRSLLNTAKVMEENPTALRLKELETLEKVVEKVGNLSVYGGLDGLLKELIKLR